MKMIVGLGNIGAKYAKTRHNVGFMVVDSLASEWNVNFDKEKFYANYTQVLIQGQKVLLVKPTTYMNESGKAFRALMDYYDVKLEDILVVYDDMDMPTGKLRLRQKGSAGGHNGIKSIIAHLKTQKFKRIKVGIDHPKQMKVVDWVLSDFTVQEKNELDVGIKNAQDAILDWLKNDNFMQTMNRFNKK